MNGRVKASRSGDTLPECAGFFVSRAFYLDTEVSSNEERG